MKNKILTKNKLSRYILYGVTTLLLIILLCIAGLCLYIRIKTGNSVTDDINYAREIVEESSEDTFKYQEGTTYYDTNGEVLGYQNTSSTSNMRSYLEYDDIPDNIVNAFIAIEDPTFWTNNGISLKGITRAFLGYMNIIDTTSGGSTISQQLAKNTFLTQDVTIDRKVKEIFIAMYLNKKYTKEQIIEFYVNQVYFSNGVYGIEDASQMYFAKSASDLTLSQATYLASIPNRPTYYNPITNPENAIDRRDRILAAMEKQDYITEEQYESAIDEEITIDTSLMSFIKTIRSNQKNNNNYLMSYAEECAQEYLAEYYDITLDEASTMLANGHYKVYTSLNTELQVELQSAINDSLSGFTAQDDNGYYKVQGAGTIIDNNTGKVIAISGGRTQANVSTLYGLNRAYQSYRQPGSSIKPLIIYTPAIIAGIDPNTFASKVWESDNETAQNIFTQIGFSTGISYLHDMNFAKIVDTDETLAAALGGLTYGVTTEEMASAYSALANSGEFVDPTCIVSIKTETGEEIYDDPETTQVYSSSAADTMTDILKGVIDKSSGTAYRSNWYASSDVEVAGKTGTTNNCKDGWFSGYCSDYTISIWVGRDDNKVVSGLYGSSYPLNIWKQAMLSTIDICGVTTNTLGTGTEYDYVNTVEEEVVEEPVVEEQPVVEQPQEETTETEEKEDTTEEDNKEEESTEDEDKKEETTESEQQEETQEQQPVEEQPTETPVEEETTTPQEEPTPTPEQPETTTE